MSCQSCGAFLHDFLTTSLSSHKHLKQHHLSSVVPEIVRWILPIYSRVENELLITSLTTASRIAQRGRSKLEYHQVIMRSSFNLLCFQLPWLRNEAEYMKVILIEKNLFRGRNAKELLRIGSEFLSYILPTSLLYLQHVHDDHVRPKGLSTPIHSLIIDYDEKDKGKESLSDRDEYHNVILVEEEDEEEDLYS